MEREGIVYGMPEATYHGGVGELSSTGAKLILEAPALFEHEVLKGNRVHRDAYDLGSIVHAKVLGTGWGVKVLEFKDWRTKAAQEARQEARAEGLIPALEHEMKVPDAMAEAVLANADAKALFESEGESEVSAFATCPETGVKLRVRADRRMSTGTIVDLKTTAGSAKPSEFARTVFSFMYDLQAAMYADVFEWVTGVNEGFKFVAVEKRAPYLVGVSELTEDYTSMGRDKAMKARRIYAACMEAGHWPGYLPGVHAIEPTMAAIYDFTDNYENGDMQL